jgi:hypothetical protein
MGLADRTQGPSRISIGAAVGSAEATSLEIYHSFLLRRFLRRAAPDDGASVPESWAPFSPERSRRQLTPGREAGMPSTASLKLSASSSSRSGLVRRKPDRVPDTVLARDLPAGMRSVRDPRVMLPYVTQLIVEVPDAQLQQQWWTVQGQVLDERPEAKQSATMFRSQLLRAGKLLEAVPDETVDLVGLTSTDIDMPLRTDLPVLLALLGHLIRLLARKDH